MMCFRRYCKECGHQVEFRCGEDIGYCPICDKEVELKEVISGERSRKVASNLE